MTQTEFRDQGAELRGVHTSPNKSLEQKSSSHRKVGFTYMYGNLRTNPEEDV